MHKDDHSLKNRLCICEMSKWKTYHKHFQLFLKAHRAASYKRTSGIAPLSLRSERAPYNCPNSTHIAFELKIEATDHTYSRIVEMLPNRNR